MGIDLRPSMPDLPWRFFSSWPCIAREQWDLDLLLLSDGENDVLHGSNTVVFFLAYVSYHRNEGPDGSDHLQSSLNLGSVPTGEWGIRGK